MIVVARCESYVRWPQRGAKWVGRRVDAASFKIEPDRFGNGTVELLLFFDWERAFKFSGVVGGGFSHSIAS